MRLSYCFLIILQFPLVHPLPFGHQKPQALFNPFAPTTTSDTSTPQSYPDTASLTPVWFSPEDIPVSSQPSTQVGNSSSSRSHDPIIAAYYPDWTASQLPPEMVDFARLDWVDFAFAVLNTETLMLEFTEDDSGDLLKRLVSAAHAMEKRVKLSIGGWTGSGGFSDGVNKQNRDKLLGNIVNMYHEYNLDGIDIDWEYPGEPGAPGNNYSPSDSENFLVFLQLLRDQLPRDAYITAATQVWPFKDVNGAPMKDVSAFAKVLDWVLLMDYDVWDSSPNPGPNAPLSDACHNSSQPEANAHAAVASWIAAGFPADQIMLGVPAYGYVSKSSATRLRSRRRSLVGPIVVSSASVGEISISPITSNVTVHSEAGSTDSGQVQFKALVAQGALVKTVQGASTTFVGAGGFQREWDACSSTPFLRSSTTGQIVAYDDVESLALKAAFVMQAGILGVNMWDAHGDTREWDLIDSMRQVFRSDLSSTKIK